MAYPKPLSKKSIEKMFSTWDTKTIETLHRYYEAFSNLYGIVQLSEAWKVFKKFEPKIHKKQFMEFSTIVRREDVSYYIFEIDELYSDERRLEKDRYIVNKEVVSKGYGKFRWVYLLDEYQYNKPYYSEADLLEAAEHRLYDTELRTFVENMIFQDGDNSGKKFSDAYFLTNTERFDLEFYKSELKRKEIRQQANIPFSDKLMKRIAYYAEFTDNVIHYIAEFLKHNDFVFESKEQAGEFIILLQDFVNKSHLWRNCGYSPEKLHSMYLGNEDTSLRAVRFGQGIQKAFADGTIDKDEFFKKLKEMGVEVIE